VIKVEDGPRPVANPEPYDALADNVKQALRQRAAQAQIENLTARLTASAKITGPGAASTGSNSHVASRSSK
jgi:peptidyl-prolyl cis-trans isomerase C